MTTRHSPRRTMVFAVHNPLRRSDSSLTHTEKEALRNPRIRGAVPTGLKMFITGTGRRHTEMPQVLTGDPRSKFTMLPCLGSGQSFHSNETPAQLTSELAASVSELVYQNTDGTSCFAADFSSIVAISGDLAHLRNRGPFIALFEINHTDEVIHAVHEVAHISTS